MSKIARSQTRTHLFKDAEMDFQFLRQLGSCAKSAASVGECLALAQAMETETPACWVEHFKAMAKRQEQLGLQQLERKHSWSARKMLYKACNSYRAAEYYSSSGTEEHLQLGQSSQRCFIHAIHCEDCFFKSLNVPYKNLHIPVYIIASDASQSSRKTLMIVSGFDGTMEEEYFMRAKDGLERGYSIVLMAGPGQMDMHRAYPDSYFEPDFESPVTTVLDAIEGHPHIYEAIGICGISLGGYFATRAASKESRIKALIANSPIVDLYAYLSAFTACDPLKDIPDSEDFCLEDIDSIPESEMPAQLKAQTQQLIYRFGKRSFKETFRYLKDFNVLDTLNKIRCPTLALCGSGEGEEPLRQYTYFKQSLNCEGHLYTAEEGADTHCQLGNIDYSNSVMYDWLDENLR